MFLAVALVANLLFCTSPKESFDFYSFGPYDQRVPRPEKLLSYFPGEKITTYHDQERVLSAIAAAAPERVKEIQFGLSNEGRPLRIFVVSSPENIRNLAAIREAHQAIAEGKSLTPTKTPAIVWVNECIHGDEPASFESGMELVYTLAASRSKQIESELKNTVVIVNPSYNPDGHERFAVYYDSLAVGSSEPGAFEQQEPSTIFGRLNHYRFDMNRDRVSMTQVETRAEVDEFFRWDPQVYIDQHGQVGSYFTPPNPMSVNVNVDRPRFNHWTDVFGRAVGSAFDQQGFSYYVKDEFDLYYAGYLDSFTSLTGAIGMTHETDGGPWIVKRRPDGTLLTLVHGVAKHFTSALATVKAASENHDELLTSYASFKKSPKIGNFKRVVVTSPDVRPLQRLQTQLQRVHVQSYFADRAFSAPDATDYWTGKLGLQQFPAGSLVVDIQQPQAAIAKTFLEPGSDFEPEFYKAQQGKKATAPKGETYPGPEGYEFYDFTAWSLPFAHSLHAYWCASAPPLSSEKVKPSFAEPADSTIGYALAYTDREDAVSALLALQAGLHAGITTKPMKLSGKVFPRGTFLFLAERNEQGFKGKLTAIVKAHGGHLLGLTSAYPEEDRYSPGSDSTEGLSAPKIGVLFGQGAQLASVGSSWWWLEKEIGLPFTPLNGVPGNLSSYTCIFAPSGASIPSSTEFHEWLNQGGVLIVLGSPARAFTAFSAGMESVSGDPERLPGSLFRAKLEPRSPLTYGFPETEIAVPIEGDKFYLTKKTGGGAVTLDADPKVKKLLSGWEFEGDTEKNLAGTVWLQDVPVGAGHVIVFTMDPTERGLWPGLDRLVLNSILLGHSRFGSTAE